MNIKFVYESHIEIQESFIGAQRKVNTPIGEGHIFEFSIFNGKVQTSPRSLCGMEKAEIGDKTTEKVNRIQSLPVCQKCADAWKNNPQSEWAKFVTAQAATE